MERHSFPFRLPAITAAHFPLTFPGWTSAPFVVSAYAGKSEGHYGTFQAWRVAPGRYDLVDQCRERIDDFQDCVDEGIDLYRPAVVLASGAPGRQALVAKLIDRHPHLVKLVEADREAEDAQLRALFDVVVERRISFPAEAPWRDLYVRQFRAVAEGKVSAAVRSAMQIVAYTHHFTVPTVQPRRCAIPGATERPGIAAASRVGFRAMTVDPRPGERPGRISTGREAIMRRLTGPMLHITTEVIW